MLNAVNTKLQCLRPTHIVYIFFTQRKCMIYTYKEFIKSNQGKTSAKQTFCITLINTQKKLIIHYVFLTLK